MPSLPSRLLHSATPHRLMDQSRQLGMDTARIGGWENRTCHLCGQEERISRSTLVPISVKPFRHLYPAVRCDTIHGVRRTALTVLTMPRKGDARSRHVKDRSDNNNNNRSMHRDHKAPQPTRLYPCIVGRPCTSCLLKRLIIIVHLRALRCPRTHYTNFRLCHPSLK